ncbi:helix-turn-helix domain-containing protein [Streptomyces sp. NPDC020983]|uniref:helix-turn-helix domain-containing protein n=1 Tax=Streptomyces sp. NPDC020983 TaxID=3365106 RepID=UPI00379E1833
MQEPDTTFEVNGQAICDARKRAGLEVKDLASAVGVTDSYIRKIERGIRKRMKPSTYSRLRTALHAGERQLLAPVGELNDAERK